MRCLLPALLALSFLPTSPAQAQITALQQRFEQPPDESRVMMRWWWFGPAVTHAQLEREMKLMKAGGIGGFEVQPLYPLAVNDERPGVKNLKFMSPEFLEAIKFTAAKAKELGLRMDLTLGSGWPYGGPQFSREEAAGRLDTLVVAVPDGVESIALPDLGNGRKLMAAFIGPANSGVGRGGRGGGGAGARGRGARGGDGAEAPAGQPDPLAAAKLKLVEVVDGKIAIPADAAKPAEVVLFLSGQTGMMVKRPADGAEGYVIDHLNSEVVDRFIREIGEPMLAACEPNPPYAIFCDSLEIGGENWTPDMLVEFQKRRGYDLKPLLPALVANVGERTMEIRHDWMQTVTELFNEEFNSRFQALAKKYNTRYRIQGYGSPAAALYSFATADLNEAEGFEWKGFDESRWASSASHLLSRPVTSSETWTWLGQAVFRARPIDMKSEADIHFLQGINQFIGHGWPYTAEGAPYPGWSMYAAAVFNQNNPWWVAMPDITKYLHRGSQMMREGAPANDVLVYMPNSDGWASTNSSLNSALGGVVGGGGGRGGRGGGGGGGTGNITGELLAAGYNLDYCDDQLLAMKGKVTGNTITFGEAKYRAVVLPPVERIMPDTMRTLSEFARNGGIVIAVGEAPKHAPGYKATDADQQAVQQANATLFTGTNALGAVVTNASALGKTLAAKGLAPDVAFATPNVDLGFVHRHTADADIYFIANTSNQTVDASAKFRMTGRNAERWDGITGQVKSAELAGETVKISLAPFESTFVVFTDRKLPTAPPKAVTMNIPAPIDVTGGWTVKFGADGPTVTMDQQQDWIANEQTKAFSGVATYTRKVNVPAGMLSSGAKIMLDFGEAPAAQGGRGGRGGGSGYRANIDSPVREAAAVTINGKRVGSVWTSPWKLDVTAALKAGDNDLQLEVGNLALNHMAANGYPNYNLEGVRRVYGNRFDPQGMNLIVPTPSGLVGPITLKPVLE